MQKKLILVFLSVCILGLSASKGSALTKGFEASSFHPAVDGGPYFTVYGTEALDQWQWVIGTMGNYSYHPLQLVQNGQRLRGIIDHEIMQDVHGAVGLVGRWLQFGVDVPIAWWLNYTDPNTAGSTSQNKMAMGDVQINLKSELLELKKHHVGLALLPFIQLPTGSGKYFAGNGGVAGGGKLLFEAKPLDRWNIALNAGALARERYTLSNVVQSHQLLYGLGTSVGITKNLSLAAEVTGRARLAKLFKNKEETPLEADGGLKYTFGDSGITVDGGGGAGIIRGSGAPTFRAFLQLAYRSPVREKKAFEEEKPVAAPSELDDVKKAAIHFKFDSTKYASAKDEETLVHVTDVLKKNTGAKAEIVGYTDNLGSKKYNKKLSIMRAKKVKSHFVKNGINAKRLTTLGLGIAEPRADNKTKEGRAKNRRVEFRVK